MLARALAIVYLTGTLAILAKSAKSRHSRSNSR
jgi:hypothetical protein